jgi:fructose-1,6-bisphosphatase
LNEGDEPVGNIQQDDQQDDERQKIQQQLDEALNDSFPASDPVSIVTSHEEEDWGEPRHKPPPATMP